MSCLRRRPATLAIAFAISLLVQACGGDLTLPGSVLPTAVVTGTPGAGTPVPTATIVCGQPGTTCATGEDCCSGICTSADGVVFTCQ